MTATKPDVVVFVIADDSTKDEIAEALTHLGRKASREMHVVGTPEFPTPWDRRHLGINALLDDYERAPA